MKALQLALDDDRRPEARLSNLLVRLTLSLCGWLAWFPGTLHAAVVRLRLVRCPGWLLAVDGGMVRTLHSVWFVKLAGETVAAVLRTRHADALDALVDFDHERDLQGGQGLVIAVCHSPWGRLMSCWFNRRHRIPMVAGGSWGRRMATIGLHPGAPVVSSLVDALRRGGKVAVVADCFGGPRTISANFLGQPAQVSAFPARLAAAGGVPLVPMTFSWTKGRIRVHLGERRWVTRTRSGWVAATQDLLAHFDERIRRDPAAWQYTFRSVTLRPPDLTHPNWTPNLQARSCPPTGRPSLVRTPGSRF